MRTVRVLAMGAMAVAAAALLVVPAFGDEGDDASFSPNPVLPGDDVTITVTGDNPCGNYGGTFFSYVNLSGPASYGPLEFFGNPGTFTMPAGAPLGLYTVNVYCATSSNTASGFVRPLLVGTVAIDEPGNDAPRGGDPASGDAGGLPADVLSAGAATALGATPTLTG